MQFNEKLGAVEAILFASGEPVDESRISEAAGIDKSIVSSMIKTLNNRYSDNQSAINIIHIGNSYQMCTKKRVCRIYKSGFGV